MSLSPRGSFWTAASVAGLALWSSGAPTVVYPLYAEEWQISPAVTTAIFAIYPVVLVPVLILFGNLSDVIGRRAVILLGLVALVLGSVAFALAPDLGWVFVGRAFMGIGVGLSLSPATAAMVEFGGPRGAQRASSTTTAATATGLALATIVGGALVQYAPYPTRLGFWVLTAVILVVGAFAFALPRHTSDEAGGAWRPRLPHLPHGERTAFVGGTLSISAAYAIGSIFLALGAQIALELVQSDNAFVDGAVIALSAIVIGVVAIVARGLRARIAVTLGPIIAAVGLALLIVAGLAHSLPAFIVSSIITGAGYALLFSGGLGLVTASAPAHERAGVISAAYVVGYVLQAATALGLGAIATTSGLQTALEIGTPVILLIGVAAAIVANAGGRNRGSEDATPSAPPSARPSGGDAS